MLKTLNDKLKLMRATREKCEELAMTMEFLEGGAIKNLKIYTYLYLFNIILLFIYLLFYIFILCL